MGKMEQQGFQELPYIFVPTGKRHCLSSQQCTTCPTIVRELPKVHTEVYNPVLLILSFL